MPRNMTLKLGKQRLVATLYSLSQESEWYNYFRPVDIASRLPDEWTGNYTQIGLIRNPLNTGTSRRINVALDAMVNKDDPVNSLILLAENCGAKFYRTNPNKTQEIEAFLKDVRCPAHPQSSYE